MNSSAYSTGNMDFIDSWRLKNGGSNTSPILIRSLMIRNGRNGSRKEV